MKSTHRFKKHKNICTSQQIPLICMQLKQNMLIPKKDCNISENFRSYEDKKFTLEEQNIKKDHINLISENLDTESYRNNGLS